MEFDKEKIANKAVKIYRSLSGSKKLRSDAVLECIMDAMDSFGIDENCEIDDETIDLVTQKLKKKQAITEDEMLQKAINQYDKIAKGVEIRKKTTLIDSELNSTLGTSFEEKRSEWETIQTRIDMLHERFDGWNDSN